jgi:hypothetical protein
VAILHIEHGITDLATWLAAFDRVADARTNAGVLAQRVCQPVDDDKYILVDLEFGTVEEAAKFKEFLETVIWQSSDMSPGLAGAPRARILTTVDTGP